MDIPSRVSKEWRCGSVPSVTRPRLLDDDSLSEILSRLPPADLCRCKSVCKDWNRRFIPSLIAARPQISFIDAFNTRCFFNLSEHDGARDINVPYLPSPPLCSSIFDLFFSERDDAMKRAAPYLPRHSRVSKCPSFTHEKGRFLGVCNGMAFASRGRASSECPSIYSFSVRNYVVMNPATGQVITIPPPPNTNAGSFNFLAFDPRVSSHHYKIISIKDDDDFQTPYLYSSLTAQWRPLENLPGEMPASPCKMNMFCLLYCCFNGVAYRDAGYATTASPAHAQRNIMGFDVKEERLFFFTTPVVQIGENQGSGTHHLGESQGYLMYTFHVWKESLFTWLLSSDGNWVSAHKIDLKVAFHPHLRSCFLISLHPLDTNAIFLANYSSRLHIAYLDTQELYQINKYDRQIRYGSILTFACPR